MSQNVRHISSLWRVRRMLFGYTRVIFNSLIPLLVLPKDRSTSCSFILFAGAPARGRDIKLFNRTVPKQPFSFLIFETLLTLTCSCLLVIGSLVKGSPDPNVHVNHVFIILTVMMMAMWLQGSTYVLCLNVTSCLCAWTQPNCFCSVMVPGISNLMFLE